MSDSLYLPKGVILNKRYEIIDVIGKGGFGITYRGFDLLLNRFVALKEFFTEQWMDRDKDSTKCVEHTATQGEKKTLESCRAGFRREAEIMKELDSIPYISRILDFFSENNTEYIVMKLLVGDNMMHYIKKKGRISPRELFPMAEQVLYAIELMHEKGFIHRDISPKNMILTKDGDLYLIDFGAATSCDKESILWNEQVFDHKGFEAPEHLTSGEQGTWTDIYSICASIIYLLTDGTVQDQADRKKYDHLPQILMNAGLSAKQQNLLQAGLSVDYKKRCSSAKELRIALCGEVTQPRCEWNVSYIAKTDKGSRNINQDNLMVDGLFCYEGTDFEKNGCIICGSDEIHIAAVCDGVGDACLGELASWAAVQALTHFTEQYRNSDELPEKLLDELLDQMNEKIIRLGSKIGIVATTLSILLWKGNHYWTVNIGDSPIYMLRGKRLSRMSIPHTKAYIKMMTGETLKLSDMHTLMNYLGKEKAAGSQMATIRHGHLQSKDTFFICSDGVMNHMDDAMLKRCLLKKDSKITASIWKVLAHNKKNDNCSAIIIKF